MPFSEFMMQELDNQKQMSGLNINMENLTKSNCEQLLKMVQRLDVVFQKLFALEAPILYNKVDGNQLTMMAVGEMGHGKSTSLNTLKLVIKRQDDPTYDGYDDNDLFKASVSTSAVTTETAMRKIGNNNIIDTAGDNDPRRTNLANHLDATNFLRINNIDRSGLSGITDVISFPTGGRIHESSC